MISLEYIKKIANEWNIAYIRDVESEAIAGICRQSSTELVIIKGIMDFPDCCEADDESRYPECRRKCSEG